MTSRRLHADWEPHAATILAWPGRAEVWDPHLEAARAESAFLAEAIAATEPLILAAQPAHLDDTSLQRLAEFETVTLMPVPLDDCWARDISPLFVADGGDTIAVQFPFNAWGRRFEPYDDDRRFATTLADKLRVPVEIAPLTLEGGAITTDGAGTAIAVLPTIVNTNRNPGWSKGAIEGELSERLGITNLVWLDAGLSGDTDTDGHVDNVAVFANASTVVCQAPAPTMSEIDRCQTRTNISQLHQAFEEMKRPIEIVELPWLPVSRFDGGRPSSYLNIVFTNDAVIVPTVGDDTDDAAISLYTDLFGDRSVVGVPSNALAYGGGGPHCMTAHAPRPPL